MAAGALSGSITEARVSTAGSMVTIESQSAGTPGGSVVMSAGTNVNLSTGAIIDVSGAGPTPGGVLSITAGQTASVDATLKGEGGAGASGGAFSLDVGSLGAGSASGENPLTLLAKSLGTGGFNEAIDLRTRSGDLDLVAGGSLSANAVTLTADSGQVIVGGTITANSDALRGSLSLFGGAGVAVDGRCTRMATSGAEAPSRSAPASCRPTPMACSTSITAAPSSSPGERSRPWVRQAMARSFCAPRH